MLQEKGHFLDFAHFVRQHALESDDLEIIFRLKSVLWAVVSILFGEMSFCITGSGSWKTDVEVIQNQSGVPFWFSLVGSSNTIDNT